MTVVDLPAARPARNGQRRSGARRHRSRFHGLMSCAQQSFRPTRVNARMWTTARAGKRQPVTDATPCRLPPVVRLNILPACRQEPHDLDGLALPRVTGPSARKEQ